jgi:3-hydroxyisobutyrate dehydrogenase-like beta-hydroxyacid dehydrogenase
VGLGIIGSRVTESLRQKGFQVFVWNRTPRPVPNFVGAPAEIAEMCDYIQIFVSDDDALLQVIQNLSSALTPRHIVMAHSTVAPHSMRAAADIVEGRGARFIEAPFTGSKLAAEKGELVYYVGGDEVALREAQPILQASSKQIVEIGEIGQATAIKVATNMITAATVQAATEALALVRSAGVPLEKFVSAMQGNASNSATLTLKLPKILEGDFAPHFSLKHMLKDMQIASRYGLSQHLELAVTAAARDRLLEQMQRGYGDEDYSAVARKYFGEVKPASREEEDLELFEKPVPVEPYPATPHIVEPAALPEIQPDFPVGMPLELVPVANELLVPEGVGSVSISAEAPTQELQNGDAVPAETRGPAAQREPLEEEEPVRRGLFSRLLRRGSDY